MAPSNVSSRAPAGQRWMAPFQPARFTIAVGALIGHVDPACSSHGPADRSIDPVLIDRTALRVEVGDECRFAGADAFDQIGTVPAFGRHRIEIFGPARICPSGHIHEALVGFERRRGVQTARHCRRAAAPFREPETSSLISSLSLLMRTAASSLFSPSQRSGRALKYAAHSSIATRGRKACRPCLPTRSGRH